jgi:excisionase family DNA binding protein
MVLADGWGGAASDAAFLFDIVILSRQRRSILDPNQPNQGINRYPAGRIEGNRTMPQDRYQTVQELSQRLEVAEATIRQWIKSGELRAIDIGKGWRISDTDLASFLASRETVPRRQRDGTGPAADA